jgi:uncharacterized protein (TIGR03000 family)
MRRVFMCKPMTLALLLAFGSLMLAAYASGQDGKPQPGDDAKKPGTPGAATKPGPATPPQPPAKPGHLAATVNVQCMPNATIWIEGQKMTSTGPVRSFQSPPLEPGKVFYYSFKVSWPGAPGQNDTVLEQEVTVRAGQMTSLDFRPQVEVPRYSRPIIREGSGIR